MVVVNKNALHEVIMNYIPKKNMDVAPPPPIFKGPIPVLGQPANVVSSSLQNESDKRLLMKERTPSVSLEKITVIKKDNSEKPMDKIEEVLDEEYSQKSASGGSKKRRRTSRKKSKGHVKKLSVLEQLIEKREKNDLVEKIKEGKRSSVRKSRGGAYSKKSYKKTDLLETANFDDEPKIHKNPFRDVEVKLKKKSSSKKKKISGGSKKRNRRSRSSIKTKPTTPGYLKYDIEKLISKDDNIAFHRIFI